MYRRPTGPSRGRGGQALARYILDTPALVAGKQVVDLGSGSGLTAIAARLAGASHVLAADIDVFAVAAIQLNAAVNGVTVEATSQDLLAGSPALYARSVSDPGAGDAGAGG
jgi:predicted nicotinamide N-methyase